MTTSFQRIERDIANAMNLHDDQAILTARLKDDGSLYVSINEKRAVVLASGEKVFYGASIELKPRQVESLRKFLNPQPRGATS